MLMYSKNKLLLYTLIISAICVVGVSLVFVQIRQPDSAQKVDILEMMEEQGTSVENLPLVFQKLYADRIQEELLYSDTATFSVFSCQYDLNHDGTDEIISYYISAFSSGSIGNVILDIWLSEGGDYRNIGFGDGYYILLNRYGGATKEVSLFASTGKTNSFVDLRYFTTNGTDEFWETYSYNGVQYGRTGDGS